jgi:probable rRNA maturation factor
MTIEVLNETDADIDVEALVRQARFMLERLLIHPEAELSLVLVDIPAMTELHIEWMDEPGPTDVLSFPMDELRPGLPGQEPVAGVLGDIVICPEVALAQAQAAGHSRDEEISLLLTHGILHLLGYDHAEPDEHAEMFGLQGDLLGAWTSARQSS